MILRAYLLVFLSMLSIVHSFVNRGLVGTESLQTARHLSLFARQRRSKAKKRQRPSTKERVSIDSNVMENGSAMPTNLPVERQQSNDLSSYTPRAPASAPRTFASSQIDVDISKEDSKLRPLTGTAQYKKQAYDDEMNPVARYFEELTAPTPQGQEPKAVKLVKQITWVSVIGLVLIEIYVSIKTGGAPFDLEKADLLKFKVPSFGGFGFLTGGASGGTPVPP